MKKIILLACVGKKQQQKTKASNLYISNWFKLALSYAKILKPDCIFILSAKYGLLDLDIEIEPYNFTLNKMTSAERKDWADKVVDQLKEKTDVENDRFVFLAGQKYRENLISQLKNYEIPLKNLAIGKQLQRLKVLLHE